MRTKAFESLFSSRDKTKDAVWHLRHRRQYSGPSLRPPLAFHHPANCGTCNDIYSRRWEPNRGTTIFIAAPPGFSSSQMNWFSVQLGIDVTQSINSGEMNLQWFLILCSGSHAFEHHLKRTKIDSIEFRISKNAMDIVLRLVSKWTQDFVLTSDTWRKRKKSRLSAF